MSALTTVARKRTPARYSPTSGRSAWFHSDAGTGHPLILLHGIGMSHTVWHPVTSYLGQTRRVIAFDIAGFGSTPPLPPGMAPTIANLVDAFEQSVRELGIDTPVDVVGNSLGGCMDIVLGLLGGILGGWLFGSLGIWPGGGAIGSILVSFVGAVILVALTRVLKRA